MHNCTKKFPFFKSGKTESKVHLISIDSIGKSVAGFPNKLLKGEELVIDAKTLPLINSVEREKFKDALLQKVETAILNIEDDSLYLHSVINYLWPEDSVKILTELRVFRSFLLNDYQVPIDATFEYIPDLNELKLELFENPKSPFTIEPVTEDGAIVQKVIYTDPFQKWFGSWYNELLKDNGISVQGMDEYKKGWRQLETWYNSSKLYLKEIDSAQKNFYDCLPDSDRVYKKVSSFLSDNNIENNFVVTNLKSNAIFKKWLWYTGGFVQINPLPATKDYRQYPSTEKTNFPDTPKTLSNHEDFKKMQTSRRIVNVINVPTSEGGAKSNLIYYDASKNYLLLNKTDAKKRLVTKDVFNIVINNLPADKNVTVAQSEKILINKGELIQQLNEYGDSLSSFTSLISQVTNNVWTRINSVLSPAFKPLPGGNFKIDVPSSAPNAAVKKASKAFTKSLLINQNHLFSLRRSQFDGFDLSDSTLIPSRLNGEHEAIEKEDKAIENAVDVSNTYVFNVEKRVVTSTENSTNDKIAILHASQLKDETDTICNKCIDLPDAGLIAKFIQSDICYEFNYKERKTLDTSAKALQKRFECFIDNYKKCNDKLQHTRELLANRFETLNLLVRINKRSLPPESLKEFTNETPLYKTINLPLVIPEKDVTVSYQLLESTAKSGASDSTNIVTARGVFKVAKYFYWDFSLGLAFTTQDYYLKTVKNDSLPTVSQAGRFRFLAGLHIYPWGLDKLDNRFAGKFPRPLSVFLGMSIPKGFENLYGGLGYDWVPGIKTIVGGHFYYDTKYTIRNNQVVDKASFYKASGLFISLNIEPQTMIKYILLLFK